jgi:hypothetical protein
MFAIVQAVPATTKRPAANRPPLIKSGLYASADRHVTMEVDVHGRRARFHFTLLCRDPYLDEYVTPGPKPAKLRLHGNRVGTKVAGNGSYEGPSESGFPGSQLTDWGMRGHFSAPNRFQGLVEFETVTSPPPPNGSVPPPLTRPQCLGSARVSLTREP